MSSNEAKTPTVTLSQRTHFLRGEPFPHVGSMATVLAALAPKQPHVDPSIEVCKLLSISLVGLGLSEKELRVQNCNRLEAHSTSGQSTVVLASLADLCQLGYVLAHLVDNQLVSVRRNIGLY